MSAEVVLQPGKPAAAALSRLAAGLDRLACVVCITLFAAILVTMILQVTFRYALGSPLVWTEELARYLFIWACYLGAPVALRRGNHIRILFLFDRLPRPLGVPLALGCEALAVVFFLVLGYQGAVLAVRSHTVEAITLPIPWSLIYAAVPLSALLMILTTLEAVWGLVRPAAAEARP